MKTNPFIKISRLLISVFLLLAGCFPSAEYYSLRETCKGISPRTITSTDSTVATWLADNIRNVTFARLGGMDIGISCSERKHYISVKFVLFNLTDSTLLMDTDAISLLDKQRIEVSRIQPHEAANLIAQEVLPAPIYTPKYVVQTTTNASAQFLYPGTLQINSKSKSVVREDIATKMGNSFAEGFVKGFNESILKAADEVYRDGFVGVIDIAPHTGKRGRLYFAKPASVPKQFIVKFGMMAEIGFKTD